MDQETLVIKIREAFEDFDKKNQGYKLIMLVSSGSLIFDSKIKLLVSAEWLDDKSQRDSLIEIIEILKTKLKEKFSLISNIHFIHTSDPLIASISKNVKVDLGSSFTLNNAFIQNFYIKNGIILKAG